MILDTFGVGNMAKKWSQVVQSQEFQNLSPDQQESARNQYFDEVVAPQVPEDKLDVVRSQFDADTSISPMPKRPTQDTIDQTREETYKAANEPKGFFEGLGEGMVRGGKQRALGIAQVLSDPFISNDTRTALEEQARQYELQGKGTGASGFIGEVLGDPLTYAPIGKAVSVGKVALGSSLVSSALSPESKRGQREQNIATGAALSPIAPLITKTVQKGGDITRKVIGSVTKNQAQDNAYKVIAENLKRQGISADELAIKAADAKRAGVGATLPEFTDSGDLITQQKLLAKGGGKAGRILRDTMKERLEKKIPQAIKYIAEPIAAGRKQAQKDFYETVLPSIELPEEQFINVMDDNIVADAFKQVRQSRIFSKELKDLPDNNYKVLQRVKERLDRNYQRLKKGSDASAAEMVRQSRDAFVEILDKNADDLGSDFAGSRRLYERGKAGEKILTTLSKTTDTSGLQIGSLHRNIFGSEAKRNALKKSLDPEEYEGVDRLMKGLKDVMRGGLSGSDTDPNKAARAALEQGTGSPIVEQLNNPTGAVGRLFNWYNDKVRQKDYEAIAKVFTDPDVAELGRRLKGIKRNDPKALVILNTQAARLLAKYGTENDSNQ